MKIVSIVRMGYKRFFEVICQESGETLFTAFTESAAKEFCKRENLVLLGGERGEIWRNCKTVQA